MIGVAVPEKDLDIAEEFFQLFKTAWEPAVSTRRYSAVLTAASGGDFSADLVLS